MGEDTYNIIWWILYCVSVTRLLSNLCLGIYTLFKLWTYYEVREKSLGNPVMAYECFPHVYEDEGEPEDISLASVPANLNAKFGIEL